MDRLSQTDRDAVVLRFLEEKSLADIGQALGLSEDAARKRVQRALERGPT
jgi:RNA polymerase sigma factor (sigma-70 family)